MNKDLSKIKISDLVAYEKAARIVCVKYENSVKNYDGTLNQVGVDFSNFEKFNKLRNAIIEEMEKRLLHL